VRLRFLLGLAVVATIAAGSVLSALVVRSKENDAFERRQLAQAQRAANQAEAVAGLSVGQLASAAAFYQTAGDLGQHEFDVMADSLLRAGALAGTAFLQSVEGSERPAFERETGTPIIERQGIGDFSPASQRDRYFPLVFAASDVDVGFETPYGYDLGADPVRSAYLLRAGDSGQPTATRVIRLLVGGTGINVFHPVYADGAPTETPAQRRAALVGFATGAFRVPDLAATATSALSDDVDAQLLEQGRPVAGAALPRGEAAAAPIQIADRRWLLVVRDPDRPGVLLPLLMAVLGISIAALLGALVVIWSRNERMEELRRQAGHDPLTGLKNRRRFDEDLRTELARSRREKTTGAVLMLDLDNFKRVNDTLGHPIGDRVIAEIAAVLAGRMRTTDVVARLGGDEFAIVLPRCELDEAEEIAEAIVRTVRLRASAGGTPTAITASVGVATFGPDSAGPDPVLAAADQALYEAKDAGGDTVRTAIGTVRPAS
jgi:diguanylate cyclase (GGDEF)-like protein